MPEPVNVYESLIESVAWAMYLERYPSAKAWRTSTAETYYRLAQAAIGAIAAWISVDADHVADLVLEVLEAHRGATPVWCECGWVAPRTDPRPTHREHVAREVSRMIAGMSNPEESE